MTDQEVREVDVLALDLDELSSKVRTGPPLDSDADRELPIWAGVLPVGLVPTGPPVADASGPRRGRRARARRHVEPRRRRVSPAQPAGFVARPS